MRRHYHNAARLARTLWVVGLLVGAAGVVAAAEPNEAPLLQPQGLSRAGVYALRQIDPNLTGQDVRVGVVCRSISYVGDAPLNDYRPNLAHACFDGASVGLFDRGAPEAGISAHATAVCSILFGEDPEAVTPFLDPFLYQGAVPAAQASVYELLHFGDRYIFNQEKPPLDVVTMSFGFQFENWWTLGIESLAEHQGMLVVAGIGNGTDASDPPLYPGAGSNALGVGVVNSVKTADPATNLTYFSLAHPDQSTSGPTIDGRSKPDVIAPGNCLVAQADDDHGYEMSGDWSSFATPVAAGVVSLMVQAAKLDENLSPVLSSDGGNCLMKAIVMNSASKLPYWHKGLLSTADDHETPLDYVQGAGMVNAVEAYRLLKTGRVEPNSVSTGGWDLNGLDGTGAPQIYRIVVDDPAEKMLTTTLVWNRHYSAKYPFERIVGTDTDLRIEVWAIDSTDSTNDLLLDWCDSRIDNVEHIYVPTLPGYSVYDIVVSYGSTESDAEIHLPERYALAWSVGAKQEADSIFWHDLSGDGVVDDNDLAILEANRQLGLTSPDAYLLGDLNTDGVIDNADEEILFANRNRTAEWRQETAIN